MTSYKQKAALEWLQAMEYRTRDNGDGFYCLKDNAPEWVEDALPGVHGTDIWPDDWRYDVIHSAACDLCDRDDDWGEAVFEIADSCVYVYNGPLLQWAMTDLSRIGAADEAAQDYGHEAGIIQRLQMAQAHEAADVITRLVGVLESRADELEAEDE
jgi:hypothetical protein